MAKSTKPVCSGSNTVGLDYVKQFADGQGKMTCETCGKRAETTRDGRELRKHRVA